MVILLVISIALSVVFVSASVALIWQTWKWSKQWSEAGLVGKFGLVDRYKSSLEAERDTSREIAASLKNTNELLTKTINEVKMQIAQLGSQLQDSVDEPQEIKDELEWVGYRTDKQYIRVERIEKTDRPGLYLSEIRVYGKEGQEDIERLARDLLLWRAVLESGIQKEIPYRFSRYILEPELPHIKKEISYANPN